MTLMMCSVCLDEFKDPRALPCLHTFCLDCLVGLCASTPNHGAVKCPMCKEEHVIPQNGAQGFRKNFIIKNFMEVNKTEEVHVKPTMCKQHPSLELTHYCEDCSQASCIQCITQNHQNHKIKPMKSICEEKLSHLKVRGEALELNHQLVEAARKELEENRLTMHDLLNRRVKDWRAQLGQEAKRNRIRIDKMISEAQDFLTVKENDIQAVKDQQKELVVGLSDTIPNIVEANADKRLDANLSSLHETLNKWSLKYSLLKAVDLDPFKYIKKSWVVKMPEQSVKGVPVALFEPVLPAVKPKAVTSRKRSAPIASSSQKTRQSLPNSTQPKKRKGKVMNSDSESDSGSESESSSESSSESDMPRVRRRKR